MLELKASMETVNRHVVSTNTAKDNYNEQLLIVNCDN